MKQSQQNKVAARKKLTKEVITTFALEGIEFDAKTLKRLSEFENHPEISAEEALKKLYLELSQKYNVNPPYLD